MNIKPLFNFVLVKPLTEEVTKSGIVLPDTINKEKPERGEVLAIGDGRFFENGQRAEMSVKVGDQVMFKKFSADTIKVDDEELLIIREGDIIAIIN
jgi:chaperonin GroES